MMEKSHIFILLKDGFGGFCAVEKLIKIESLFAQLLDGVTVLQTHLGHIFDSFWSCRDLELGSAN
jgi:hypothetical protein